MTREVKRYVELATAEKTLRVGFAPPAPDGTPSSLVTVCDGTDKLLASFTPADVKDAALDVIGMKPNEPVEAKRARMLACFALAFINLRPELLPGGASPSVSGGEAGAAAPAAAPAADCGCKR